ncbi:MAG: hypothetical protein ACT4TC_03795 [Myxococcaceae bacterium]
MERTQGNGKHGVGERVEQIGDSAQQLWSDARGAVTDLSDSIDLKGRMERHPYATLAAAVGVGYLLGGGLFTPLTASIFRLGVRLAALPFVKDELLGMAETALDNLTRGVPDNTSGPRGPGSSSAV